MVRFKRTNGTVEKVLGFEKGRLVRSKKDKWYGFEGRLVRFCGDIKYGLGENIDLGAGFR